MGGPGSGSWYRWNSGVTVESCRSVDIRRWHREGLLHPGRYFGWCWRDPDTGEEQASIGVTVWGQGGRADSVQLRYSCGRDDERQVVDYHVPVTWTPCNYGGARPWFVCPGRRCGGRRVALLYLGGQYFLCRHCYGLTYESQREDRGSRLLRRANKIRVRLGGRPGMAYPFPQKPPRMRWRTYWRLREEAEQAEAESWIAATERFGFILSRLEERLSK